ncbi:helix-turn-helix domain-containing protein [Daejeonella sp. JGW-45]|uniref:helix-turn-helix domain-containing protein n=1 Tax=Daejeonella sp. JGW-45 TaxID=3034148 RepID=UPI0023ED537E|nr:helix-turn-helix domain-containing protein [Daejeonella sp. JGW-45]
MSELELNYKDQLIYLSIRSFYNTKDKYCYPSYKAIAKRAGVSDKTVSASVKRLDAAKMLEIWKVGKSRHYHAYKFPESDCMQKIPYAILEIPDLTMHERSMLITLFEYLNEDYKTHLTITELETASGESYKTINTQLKSLQMKGYITVKPEEIDNERTLIRAICISDNLKSLLPDKLEEVKATINSSDRSENIMEMAMKLVRGDR